MDSYKHTKGEVMDNEDHPGDKDIIAGLIRGDRLSADNLVRKYQHRLRAFLEHGMHLPWDVGQELLQDVFYRIISKPGVIRPGTDRLDRFLFVACKNAAIDWHRKRKKEKEYFAEVVEELLSGGEIHDPSVESPSTFPEPHIVLLKQSLSGLDQQKRQVLRMSAERVQMCRVARGGHKAVEERRADLLFAWREQTEVARSGGVFG